MTDELDLSELLDTALHGTWGGDGSHWADCYYTHRDCAVRALVVEVTRLQRDNESLRSRLSLIFGLTLGRDGLATAESLGQLVDEVHAICTRAGNVYDDLELFENGGGHDGPTVRVVADCHWCGRSVPVDERGNCSFCGWPRRDDEAVEVDG
jgi:hypothetical protein